MITVLMNEHFIESEVEYLRQQRLAAATEYRRAKSAARVQSLRERLASAVEHVTPRRSHRDRTAPAA